eukprot:scaffold5885_cov201-Amphora_coffeaeformis.AAC.23
MSFKLLPNKQSSCHIELARAWVDSNRAFKLPMTRTQKGPSQRADNKFPSNKNHHQLSHTTIPPCCRHQGPLLPFTSL